MLFYAIIYNNLKGEFIMFSYKQKRSLALLDTIITILAFVCLIVTIMIILIVNEKISQYVNDRFETTDGGLLLTKPNEINFNEHCRENNIMFLNFEEREAAYQN